MRRLLLVLLLASPAYVYADTEPHKEGDYGGVVPGQKADTATRPAKPKRAPPKGTLTWIGFEAKDGGAQLFLQSTSAFQVAQKVVGGTLVVTTNDLTRLGTNTWRQVDTRFFDNPLSGVVARAARRKKGIEVRIQFKHAKDAREATLRTATEADGMFYAYLSFPAGTPTDTPKAAEPAKPDATDVED